MLQDLVTGVDLEDGGWIEGTFICGDFPASLHLRTASDRHIDEFCDLVPLFE